MHFVYLRVLETLWLLFVYSILIQPHSSTYLAHKNQQFVVIAQLQASFFLISWLIICFSSFSVGS